MRSSGSIKKYIAALAASAMIAGCSPDPPNYEIKHLRIVRTYPRNKCVEMYYDLDDDKIIDVIEFRRWNPSKGIISGPFVMVWDKNKDMVISREEGYRRPDPIPDAPPCPPCDRETGDSVL